MNKLILALLAALTPAVFAQDAAIAATPTTNATTIPSGALKAKIVAVQGTVQVRDSEEDPWRLAKPDMELSMGAEFRTGVRSSVQFVIPPDQTVTLDRMTTIKLLDLVSDKEKVKTDLGMKYGRVQYEIDVAGLQHESTIHSPGAALAVRGTTVILYDQAPFKPQAVSLTGVARFRNSKNQMVKVGGEGTAVVDSDQSSVAQNNLGTTQMRSESIQQTLQQARELSFLASHNGKTLGNVGASTVPVSNSELPSLLSGNLDFVLRWLSPSMGFSDLNIVVRTPQGEIFGNPPFILSLYPDNPQYSKFLKQYFPSTSKSGGAVGMNSIGPAGLEIASFGKNYPRGVYVVSVYNFMPPAGDQVSNATAGNKVPFTIEAFVGKKHVPVIVNFPNASNYDETPILGDVFKGSVGVGEMQTTATYVGERMGAAQPTKKPQNGKTSKPTTVKKNK